MSYLLVLLSFRFVYLAQKPTSRHIFRSKDRLPQSCDILQYAFFVAFVPGPPGTRLRKHPSDSQSARGEGDGRGGAGSESGGPSPTTAVSPWILLRHTGLYRTSNFVHMCLQDLKHRSDYSSRALQLQIYRALVLQYY